jgi:hypothetical protein
MDSPVRLFSDSIPSAAYELVIVPMRPEELTALERRFLTAIHFYRKANFAFESIDKIVNYVVALESMLVMSEERPSTTLLKRIPEVLWVNTEHRSKLKNIIRRAYQLRSRILHSGLRNKGELEPAWRDLMDINRSVLATVMGYLNKPGVSSLEKLLQKSEEDAAAYRADELQKALLKVNQTYSGHGDLKDDVSTIRRVDFLFSYRDDGKYISKEGSITKIELLGRLSRPSSVLEGSFNGVNNKFRLEFTSPLDQLDVFELARGHVEKLSFIARSISTV